MEVASFDAAPVLALEECLEIALEIGGLAALVCCGESVHRRPVVVPEIGDERGRRAGRSEGKSLSGERDAFRFAPPPPRSARSPVLDAPGHRATKPSGGGGVYDELIFRICVTSVGSSGSSLPVRIRPPGRVTRTISLATSKGRGANIAPKMLTTRSKERWRARLGSRRHPPGTGSWTDPVLWRGRSPPPPGSSRCRRPARPPQASPPARPSCHRRAEVQHLELLVIPSD